MRYVCWHPLLTDHQSHTYAALIRLANGELVVNVERVGDSLREAQGWVRQSVDIVPEQSIPSQNWHQWAKVELAKYPTAIHVFGSPFESFRQMRIMYAACRLGLRVAVISEPFSTTGLAYLEDTNSLKNSIKSWLRPIIYKAYGAIFARKIHAVFAISPLACDQYRSIGIPAEKIYPFGYFVPANDISDNRNTELRSHLRLVFVGSLIARKGLRIAIQAVQSLLNEGYRISLDVFGAGDPEQYDFSPAIKYVGVVPFGQAAETISKYDALLLPSLFDGWGVVVNEALQAGTPVCCSTAVGAGAVVEAYDAGEVFSNGDVSDLTRILRAWCNNRDRLKIYQANARRAALQLTPTVAANYFDSAIIAANGRHERPAVPWYKWPAGANK